MSAKSAPAHLKIIEGPNSGRTIQLDQPTTPLGSAGAQTAAVLRGDSGYRLSALQGTAPELNGEAVGLEERPLADGDRIRIGGMLLQFCGGDSPEAGAGRQRRFSRVPFDAMVVLRGGGGEWRSELIDLSLKGALIRLPTGWTGRDGDPLRLELELDSGEKVCMEARVARQDAERVGLQCQDIDIDSITTLRRLVELNLGDAELLERELGELGG